MRDQQIVWFPRRSEYTSETKPFYLTSEFLVFVLYLMGLGISASTDSTIDARLFWILTTVAGRPAVVPQITGLAHRTGEHTFVVDPADPLVPGFVLR